MSELSEMRCTACRGDEPTLTDAEDVEAELISQLDLLE